jgi:hypothetical protein
MWALLSSLMAKYALLKLILKTLGSLGLLVPLAFLLKLIGLPILIILGILAAPIIIVLAIIGLPLMFILVIGGMLLAALFALLSLGFAVLKIAIPIILVYWLLRWWFNGRSNSTDPAVD